MTSLLLTLLGVAATVGGVAMVIGATAHRRRPWSDRTTGRLAWAACAWAVLTAVVLLFAPLTSSSTSSVSVSVDGSGSSTDPQTEVVTTTSSETLVEHEGASVIAVLLVPVAVTLVGALGHGPPTRRRRIAAGWVLAGACLLGSASLGTFFLPAAVALLAAGVKTRPAPGFPPVG